MKKFTGFHNVHHLSHIAEYEEIKARIADKVWYSTNKERYINFKAMDDRHIQNCIRMLEDGRTHYSSTIVNLYITAFTNELRERMDEDYSPGTTDDEILLLL